MATAAQDKLAECRTVRGYHPTYIVVTERRPMWKAQIHFEPGRSYDNDVVNAMVEELEALLRKVARYASVTPEFMESHSDRKLELVLSISVCDRDEVYPLLLGHLAKTLAPDHPEVVTASLYVHRNPDGTIKQLEYTTWHEHKLMEDLHDDWGQIASGRFSLVLDINGERYNRTTKITVIPRPSQQFRKVSELHELLQRASKIFIYRNFYVMDEPTS